MTTTTTIPPGLVTGAPRQPLPFGLFSVVAFSDEGRWGAGVEFEAPSCGPVEGYGPEDCGTGTEGLPRTPTSGSPVGEALPFLVYASDTCSLVGNSFDRAQARADEQLALKGEHRVEQAFWTGDLGNEPYLASASATTLNSGTATAPAEAVALLEEHVATEYGAVGVIHVTRGMAVHLLKGGLVSADGSVLRTSMGTPVVAGTGYPGTGPTGAAPQAPQAWAYVTPALFGRRSAPFVLPGMAGLETPTNDLTAVAEQKYLIGHDPCPVGAVLIDPSL